MFAFHHLFTRTNHVRRIISTLTCNRVGYDKKQHDEFIEGYEPLIADDIAEAALYMLSQKDRISIKAMDVVPTAQRSLQVFDRNWDSRSKDR